MSIRDTWKQGSDQTSAQYQQTENDGQFTATAQLLVHCTVHVE
jgi:hypothetical protein